MNCIEILLIGIGLGMDAMSVSICKGLSMQKMEWKKAIVIGLYFGFFQALMPFLGFTLGAKFHNLIDNLSHWIAFGMLEVIGGNMIIQSFKSDEEKIGDDIKFKEMIVLAIATSIDALAVGVTFAILEVNIIKTSIIIGITTFVMSVLGVKIGKGLSGKLKYNAEILGGIILITMGIKILIS